jgi:hypothetical protein
LLAGWTQPARALHVVSDETPEGRLNVPPQGRATIILDISPRDFVQWIWSDDNGQAAALSTQLVWTDTAGVEHTLARLPAGALFGNFDAPANLASARLEWHNGGNAAGSVAWSYSASAAFWKRPEFFLPAMLPLFLLAGAIYFGRRLDRRNRLRATGQATNRPARAGVQQETVS